MCIIVALIDGTNVIESFGIRTYNWNGDARTLGTVILTLWFDGLIYQCSVNPIKVNTIYACSNSNRNIRSTANYNPKCIDNKMKIDNGSQDRLYLDKTL